MTLVLIGTAGFTSTQRVQAVLAETQTPYRLQNIAFSDYKIPEHIAKNPFGQTPVLLDGDFVLYESRAICKYIALKYQSPDRRLLPASSDLQATALFEQATFTEISHYEHHISALISEKHVAPMYAKVPDEARITAAREGLRKTLDVYELILEKQEYMSGNTFSLVDIFHLPYTELLFACGETELITTRPRVLKWWENISKTPGWLKVCPKS